MIILNNTKDKFTIQYSPNNMLVNMIMNRRCTDIWINEEKKLFIINLKEKADLKTHSIIPILITNLSGNFVIKKYYTDNIYKLFDKWEVKNISPSTYRTDFIKCKDGNKINIKMTFVYDELVE